MTAGRIAQLLAGCALLGVGVALLLTPALGSDGFSTLVSGLSRASGMPFVAANVVVSAAFVLMAWLRGVRPGPGTLVQVVLVGAVANLVLVHLGQPDQWWSRAGMLLVAFPVVAAGIALYLGTHLGAGPAEAAALAWDPPVPFAWSYNAVQGGGALLGWLLGAAVGPGTVAVILLLGPVVTLAGRVLRQDIRQRPR